MNDGRQKTLAEELQEVASVAPRREDYLEGELEGAPLTEEADEQLEALSRERLEGGGSVGRLKGLIALEDEAYEGEEVSRDQIFDEESSIDEVPDELPAEGEDIDQAESDREAPAAQTGDLYEEYNRLQSDVGLSDLRHRAMKDREKGLAVQRDKHIWEQCLELRIALQRSLTASHRLPPEAFRTQLMKPSQLNQSRCEQVLELCHGVMSDLMDLEDCRLAGKRQKTSESKVQERWSSAQATWDVMEENYSVLNRFCDASLDRFHRQAMLQSGATTKKGSLSLLHQGISSQVQSMMQTPKKALMKARMPVSEQPRVLGILQYEKSNGESRDSDAVNPEMFVDTDFYETLLNEHLVGHGMEKVAIESRKRSSHGVAKKRMRLIFTEVQEKLVNFMTPSDSEPPAFSKQLFHNLFLP